MTGPAWQEPALPGLGGPHSFAASAAPQNSAGVLGSRVEAAAFPAMEVEMARDCPGPGETAGLLRYRQTTQFDKITLFSFGFFGGTGGFWVCFGFVLNPSTLSKPGCNVLHRGGSGAGRVFGLLLQVACVSLLQVYKKRIAGKQQAG